eukprot:gene7460-10170_t
MQDAVKLFSDTFDVKFLDSLCLVFTKSSFDMDNAEEDMADLREKAQGILGKIELRTGHKFAVRPPVYQVDCHTEKLKKRRCPQEFIDYCEQQTIQNITDMLRWVRNLKSYPTSNIVAAEYEHVSKLREAEQERVTYAIDNEKLTAENRLQASLNGVSSSWNGDPSKVDVEFTQTLQRILSDYLTACNKIENAPEDEININFDTLIIEANTMWNQARCNEIPINQECLGNEWRDVFINLSEKLQEFINHSHLLYLHSITVAAVVENCGFYPCQLPFFSKENEEMLVGDAGHGPGKFNTVAVFYNPVTTMLRVHYGGGGGEYKQRAMGTS